MAATTSAPAAVRTRERTRLDRLLAVVPAAAIALVVLIFYFVEAWSRKTPWVFTDEIEWTQISRSIASTGHAARRGDPIFFKTLYAWLIAPAWWIHGTGPAYSAIKYLNAVVMTAAAVPTYLLARMLVSKRTAFVVATLSVAIPGMAYATSLIPEVLAYPWYALCSWLIVRALLPTRRRRDVVLAIAVSIAACYVRWTQFATVPAAFAIAAGTVWITGPNGKELRKNWSRSDTLGAVVLLAGALMLFNRTVLQHVQIWQISTQYWKNRMVDLGLRAGLAFTVGLGVLPVLGGFASLRLPERRHDPVYRAFAAYLGATIICLSLYTAVKAAYLSTVFSTLTEERNMIYLSPLLLIGTALVFGSRQISWTIIAAATAFVGWLVWAKQIDLLYPYYEAPGFGILVVWNRHLGWDTTDLRLAMMVVLAASVVLLAVRRIPGIAVGAVVLSLAWMLTSEIATTAGSDHLANNIRRHLPVQLDWIDQQVRGQSVTYLGQEIKDPNGLWLTEFWNRSIHHVDSLDGSAPGPGPAGVPSLLSADGRLSLLGDEPYVVTDNGVSLQAPAIARWNQLVLYKRSGPWRLLDSEQQVYSDGWAPGWSTYTYFKPHRHGTLRIILARTGYNGSAPPGHATVTVGSVKIVGQQPQLNRAFAKRELLVRNNSSQVLTVLVRETPFRVVVRIKPTFHASVSDPRDLGAQVSFTFVPAKSS